jgi:hypothetical protein
MPTKVLCLQLRSHSLDSLVNIARRRNDFEFLRTKQLRIATLEREAGVPAHEPNNLGMVQPITWRTGSNHFVAAYDSNSGNRRTFPSFLSFNLILACWQT